MDCLQTVVSNINMEINTFNSLLSFYSQEEFVVQDKIELQQMKRKGCITTNDKIHVRKEEDKKDTGQ